VEESARWKSKTLGGITLESREREEGERGKSVFSFLCRRDEEELSRRMYASKESARKKERKRQKKPRRNSPPRTRPRPQRLPLNRTQAPSSPPTLLLLHPTHQTPTSSSSETASYRSYSRLAPSTSTLPRWDRNRSRSWGSRRWNGQRRGCRDG